jgi:hypothetical protein
VPATESDWHQSESGIDERSPIPSLTREEIRVRLTGRSWHDCGSQLEEHRAGAVDSASAAAADAAAGISG